MAVLVKREFGVDNFVEAVSCRGKIFQPVAGPVHRPTEAAGKHRNDDLLQYRDALPPRPPPTSAATTRTLCPGMPRRSARMSRMMPGICVDAVRVSERRPRSYSARQARFSMANGV